jgi:hypothetical protein
MQLIDITGRVIMTDEFESGSEDISVNVNEYPQGLYFVALNIDGNRVTRRIMLAR